MKWYNVFSNVYDSSLEKLYFQSRKRAIELLELNDERIKFYAQETELSTTDGYAGVVSGSSSQPPLGEVSRISLLILR